LYLGQLGHSPYLKLFLDNSPSLLTGDDGQQFVLQRQRCKLGEGHVYWLEMYDSGGASSFNTLSPSARFAFEHGYIHLLQAVRHELHSIQDVKTMLKEIRTQLFNVSSQSNTTTALDVGKESSNEPLNAHRPAPTAATEHTPNSSGVLAAITAMSEDMRRLQIEMAIQRRQIRVELNEIRRSNIRKVADGATTHRRSPATGGTLDIGQDGNRQDMANRLISRVDALEKKVEEYRSTGNAGATAIRLDGERGFKLLHKHLDTLREDFQASMSCQATHVLRMEEQGKGRLDALTMEHFELKDQMDELRKRLAVLEEGKGGVSTQTLG